MGNLISRLSGDYVLWVKTGDRKGAGTDANVFAYVVDTDGKQTKETKLDNLLRNDHERNSSGSYWIPKCEELGKPDGLVVWRDQSGFLDDWYLEVAFLAEKASGLVVAEWPVHRWIKVDKKYHFSPYDCLLPQNDPNISGRLEELREKRTFYEFTQNLDGAPVQVATIPDHDCPPNLREMKSMRVKIETKLISSTSAPWSSMSDIKNIYRLALAEPSSMTRWSDDSWFAAQRLQGINPLAIRLCTEIPPGFLNDPNIRLDSGSLEQALEEKKLFIVDHDVLRNLPCKDDRVMVAPIGLFYVNRRGDLHPLGIQLFPDASQDNPIFSPSDPPYAWTTAKMYFNMADANVHRAWLWYGLTHLLVESVWVCCNRNLSPSHPIFRLLAPHMHTVIRANAQLQEKLLCPGGWMDTSTSMGMRGMQALIARCFSRFDIIKDLDVERLIESNGTSKDTLSAYPFREDALLVYKAIETYVRKVITTHYKGDSVVQQDQEIKEWKEELEKSRRDGGCNIKGLPEGAGFSSCDQLVVLLTNLISCCTLFNSAYNTGQYEQIAYIPNYPLLLRGSIPRNTDIRTERDVVNKLPCKDTTMNIVNMMKFLSTPCSSPLGETKEKYLFHPQDVKAYEEFRQQLETISGVVKGKNCLRKFAYEYLDPKCIPHSVEV